METGPRTSAWLHYVARLMLGLAIFGLGIWAGWALFSNPACASTQTAGFTVSGSTVLVSGEVPHGFSDFTFGNGILTFEKYEYADDTAQLRAIAGAWHGNVVRMQIGQYAMLHGSNGQSAQVFRDKVYSSITYALSLGIGVIINDTTESTGGLATRNEPGPTSDTLAFWRLMERYQGNPDVALDLFNEPRWSTGGQLGDWSLLFHGNATYIGEDALIRDIRGMGFTNQLWIEATGNMALTELGVTWPEYEVTDPLGNFVYEYHHTTVDGPLPTQTGWNVQFGNLVTQRHVPVIDGEWTNRSNPPGSGTPSADGDLGQCWGNAPVSVPAYLSYLQERGIGMTVWALGNVPDEHPAYSMINADTGMPGTATDYTTANSYANWAGCLTPPGGHTSGAGQLVMEWYAGLSSGR